MTIPARKGRKKSIDIITKIFSAWLWVSSSVGKSMRPTMPIPTAAVREIITQNVAILLDIVNSLGFLIAMNFNKTWGIPKYPSPQDKVEMMDKSPYFDASSNNACPFSPICCTPSITWGWAILKKSKKPDIVFALSITAFSPPAWDMPNTSTAVKAKIITILCIKSDALSAKNPPTNVYSTTKTAPAIII